MSGVETNRGLVVAPSPSRTVYHCQWPGNNADAKDSHDTWTIYNERDHQPPTRSELCHASELLYISNYCNMLLKYTIVSY